jgi:hypothetical protein
MFKKKRVLGKKMMGMISRKNKHERRFFLIGNSSD